MVNTVLEIEKNLDNVNVIYKGHTIHLAINALKVSKGAHPVYRVEIKIPMLGIWISMDSVQTQIEGNLRNLYEDAKTRIEFSLNKDNHDLEATETFHKFINIIK